MAGRSISDAGAPLKGRTADAHTSPASVVASEIKALVASGDRDAARERFGALVALLQRRALRIAFQYLRNPADADEAVQDAFVKVFLHIDQYREHLSFDVWFTRILVNASLDRLRR
jgi:RNA polymerase sigma-70 factor (ECF subfamily)